MSAFICNDSHITALAAYTARHRIHVLHDGKVHRFDFDDMEKVGAILHAENVRSVNHRYREETEPDFAACPWAEHRPFRPIEILKAATCLEYQSCEHPEWGSSLANEILRVIVHTAIGELPGYDEADGWEISPPARAEGRATA